MDEEQIVIAEAFLNELVSLGTLVQVADDKIVANGPLFCLPKAGQPGPWRILSDMRRGGQNEAYGLPKIELNLGPDVRWWMVSGHRCVQVILPLSHMER
jgi:hypothetical protein